MDLNARGAYTISHEEGFAFGDLTTAVVLMARGGERGFHQAVAELTHSITQSPLTRNSAAVAHSAVSYDNRRPTLDMYGGVTDLSGLIARIQPGVFDVAVTDYNN